MRNKSLLILILMFLIAIWLLLVTDRHEVDEQTKALCRWYAQQNHDGEIGKERIEKMGYLWKDFDYYQSCLKNSGK